MGNLLSFAVYNPAILSDEDFLTGFLARRDLAERLLHRLGEITPTGLAHHHLILGQRGMGKTSLLRRLALGVRDDAQLSAVLLPLTFREEQYNVNNLHTFWCNCLDALGDWFEKTGQTDKAETVDRDVAALTQNEVDPNGNAALEVFLRWAKSEGKRPLLLLDNIDIVLNGLNDQHWNLRKALQVAGGIVVVGASANYMEATADRDAAFYDFFQVTVLEKLSRDELLTCLRGFANERGEKGRKVLAAIDNDPGRIPTLHDLTGGNPRTLILLYLLLELDAEGDVLSDLERLLDQVTVLYKARVEELPAQARTVLDAVALAWNPIIAKQVAATTGLKISATSSQLDRLQKDGIVEKVGISTSSRTAFQLSERFFNIWYLMRHGPRRLRTRLRWLTEFLRGFYTPQQLTERAKELLTLENLHGLDRGHYYMAMSDAMEDQGWRNLLGNEARIELERQAGAMGTNLKDLVDPAELPTPQSANDWLVHGNLLRKHLKRHEDAETAYRKAIEIDSEYATAWRDLGLLLTNDLDRHDEAETTFRKAIEVDPNVAASWNSLGDLLDNYLDRYEEAETAYRKAIKVDSGNAYSWARLANLLTNNLDRHDQAETAYRKAIEIDSEFAASWFGLGILLTSHLDRHDEAETAIRKAIELGLEHYVVWEILGLLLTKHLDCHEEAETAFRKAIEISPEYAELWSNLGFLLTYRLDRHEEAEAAWRKAIEFDPKDAIQWSNLGFLLTNHLDRHDEAETAYRNAIEIDSGLPAPWYGLGVLLTSHLDRHEEAESAYWKAIELDHEYAELWLNLGLLLTNHLDRYEEAETAFRRAIDIDPKNNLPWLSLGLLLTSRLDRHEEAETAYRKSIELNSDDTQAWRLLGSLLMDHSDQYKEAEITFRKAIELAPDQNHSYHKLGFLLLYYLGRPTEAAAFYGQALKYEPGELVAESNLLALRIVYPESKIDFDGQFDDIVGRHPPHGASLLRAIRAMTRDNFGEAISEFAQSLDKGKMGIMEDYHGFVLLFLRLTAERGYGDKLIETFNEQGLSERFWPLHAAFDAYVHGEARLMDVNPEVRGAAKRIYGWLDSPRRATQESNNVARRSVDMASAD